MVISGGGPWNPVETALSGGLAPGMEHIPLPMLDEYTQAAYDLYPDFFVPLINGFDATDSSSAAYISNLLAIPNNPWKGVGEIIVYGHEVYTSDGSSPSFLDIFDVAGQNNLPVLCHWELTPSDVVTLDPNPIQFQQLVSAVTSFPNTRFVIAHCGVGPAISIQVRDAYDLGHYPEIDFFKQQVDDWRNNISNLLALGNVYFDFQGPDNVYSDGSLTLVGEKIQALIEHYPTRFMVGADISANSAHIQLASFAPFGWNTYDSISAFLDHLTPSEQQLVRYENAVTIYENAGASGATVVGPTKVVNFPGYPGQHTLFP